MKRKNATRSALLTSIISLLLCVSMLVGTTFAWFTDEVKSGTNVIAAGNLDVELYHSNTKDSNEKVTASTKLFDEVTPSLWEPGAVAYENLTVVNEGTLALKYQLAVNFENATEHNGHSLDEALKVGVVRGGFVGTTRDAILAEVEEWQTMESFNLSGELLAEKSETYGIVIWWEPTENDNWFNMNNENQGKVLSIDLGVKLFATQMAYEEDSFGNTYDKDASVVVSEDGLTLPQAIAQVEDNGTVFIEPGTYILGSVINISNKNISIVGLGDVTLQYKATGGTHFFNVANGSNVTFENLTMLNAAKHGVYVRNNSVVTMKDVTIEGSRDSADIMIDEASDVINGAITETTASYVQLNNCDIGRIAMCAAPTEQDHIDTYVYLNYDAASTVGSIEVQNINLKPQNIIINGVASTEVGKTMQLYVSNDAELTAALETIKNDEAYWNKQVIVYLAAGEYSANYEINQYPLWNGVAGTGATTNNYASGVSAGAPGTVITFVGETAVTYSPRANIAPAVVFTGKVTVNGFGNAGAGFGSTFATTTFQNVAFDGANIAPVDGDVVAVKLTAAADNVYFENCAFQNTTHVILGYRGENRIDNVYFDGCTFSNAGSLSGYPLNVAIAGCTVDGADGGFLNIQNEGVVSVSDSTINVGRYFIRTNGSGVELTVEDSDITVYESEGTKYLVYFRGSNESAEFVDCTIADGWTTEGVDANSTLEIYNFSETEDGLILVTDGITDEVTLYLVPAEYEGAVVNVPEGVDSIGNYAFSYNSNVKEVILASTVRDLGRGFDSSTVEKVVLNEGLTTISSRAFKATTALKEVVISSTVTTIADDAFQKTCLKTITIPANVEYIGVQAFGATKIENVIIEGNVTINNKAFRGCANLKTFTINGDNIEFINVNSGSGNCWICNSESNNPGTSKITFNVKNPMVKEKVLSAMGHDITTITINCEVEADANGMWENADGKICVYATDNTALNTAITGGAETVYLGSGNYIIPDSAKGKTLAFVGNGNTIVATQDDGSYEGCDYSLDGSTAVFENIVINTNSANYTGYARLKATYNNCTINGTFTLYDDSVFNNCTFNVSGDVYNIWTWGAPTANFNNCTFNSDGKAMLLYGSVNTKLTIDGCTFNDKGGLTDLKAAIEIGNDYGTSYELIVNNTTVNGYEINDKGINTGTTLWANKNSMGTDKLNVVVDGIDVY